MSPDQGGTPERRAYPRMPLTARFHLEFQELRYFLSESATDLCAGGAFIKSEASIEPGQSVSFDVRLTKRGPRTHGKGEVVWVRPEPESPARPAGFALRFDHLEPAGHELLARLGELYTEGGEEVLRAAVEEAADAWEQRQLEEDATGSVPAPTADDLPDTASMEPVGDVELAAMGDEERRALEDDPTAAMPVVTDEELGVVAAEPAEPPGPETPTPPGGMVVGGPDPEATIPEGRSPLLEPEATIPDGSEPASDPEATISDGEETLPFDPQSESPAPPAVTVPIDPSVVADTKPVGTLPDEGEVRGEGAETEVAASPDPAEPDEALAKTAVVDIALDKTVPAAIVADGVEAARLEAETSGGAEAAVAAGAVEGEIGDEEEATPVAGEPAAGDRDEPDFELPETVVGPLDVDVAAGGESEAVESAPPAPRLADAELDRGAVPASSGRRVGRTIVVCGLIVGLAGLGYMFRDSLPLLSDGRLGSLLASASPASEASRAAERGPAERGPAVGTPPQEIAPVAPDAASAPETGLAQPGEHAADAGTEPPDEVGAEPMVAGVAADAGPVGAPGEPVPGFVAIEGIDWGETDDGAWVKVDVEGFLPPGSYSHFRVNDERPREVIQLFGGGPDSAGMEIPIESSALIGRIRTGFHAGEAGAEVHVVLDLLDPATTVEVETDGSSLLIRLQ